MAEFLTITGTASVSNSTRIGVAPTRGLSVVEALAQEWGVLGDDYARAVWAKLRKPKPKKVRA